MTVLAPGLSWVDLNFLGRPHAIATALVHGGGTLALVDPGTSTCLDTLALGWQESVARIEAASPHTMFLTHFGPVHSIALHLQTLMENLETRAAIVRKLLAEPGADDEKMRRFADDLTRELRRQMTEAQVGAYVLTAPPEQLWLGLARYWKKKAG